MSIARSKMVLRATVERNTASGADAYGGDPVPAWGAHLTLACWVYNDSKRLVVDGDKDATIEGLKIMYPLGSDITEADRITVIKDRNSVTLYSANYEINNPVRVHTHMRAELKVVE